MASFTITCKDCGWEKDVEFETRQEAEDEADITLCDECESDNVKLLHRN